MLRVELSEDNKILHKQCSCGEEFSTAIPRKFFKHPNDTSLELAKSGGAISGFPSISADALQARIEKVECGVKERHPEA